MQKSQLFSGTVSSLGSKVSRLASYGGSYSLSEYTGRTDWLNQTIADFLTSCGVNAKYEVRAGDAAKWLWINDVPFLFINNTTNNTCFIAPKDTSYTLRWSGKLFTDTTTGAYNFTLIFAGSPNTGFILRIKFNGTTAINNMPLIMMFGKNVANDHGVVAWSADTSTAGTSLGQTVEGIEVADGVPVLDIFQPNSQVYSYPGMVAVAGVRGISPKYPLIPFFVGPWQMNGIFLHITGYNLPEAAIITQQAQTEMTLGSRTFLVLSPETTMSGTFIGFGLWEVTDSAG